MNCLDCALGDRVKRAAVGICTDCGAGVCADHVVQRERRPARPVPDERQVMVGMLARVLRCGLCDMAHQGLGVDGSED